MGEVTAATTAGGTRYLLEKEKINILVGKGSIALNPQQALELGELLYQYAEHKLGNDEAHLYLDNSPKYFDNN